MPLHKTTEDKFVKASLEMLKKQLAREGIIIRKVDNLKDTVLEIGKLYYKLKRKEGLF